MRRDGSRAGFGGARAEHPVVLVGIRVGQRRDDGSEHDLVAGEGGELVGIGRAPHEPQQRDVVDLRDRGLRHAQVAPERGRDPASTGGMPRRLAHRQVRAEGERDQQLRQPHTASACARHPTSMPRPGTSAGSADGPSARGQRDRAVGTGREITPQAITEGVAALLR